MKDGVHLRLPLPIKADCEQEYTDLMPASDTADWPSASDLGFNDSQYSAFKAALTQEFSLLQGTITHLIDYQRAEWHFHTIGSPRYASALMNDSQANL